MSPPNDAKLTIGDLLPGFVEYMVVERRNEPASPYFAKHPRPTPCSSRQQGQRMGMFAHDVLGVLTRHADELSKGESSWAAGVGEECAYD